MQEGQEAPKEAKRIVVSSKFQIEDFLLFFKKAFFQAMPL